MGDSRPRLSFERSSTAPPLALPRRNPLQAAKRRQNAAHGVSRG
jgi:hypothetical protein